jgi:hypothetical protein
MTPCNGAIGLVSAAPASRGQSPNGRRGEIVTESLRRARLGERL